MTVRVSPETATVTDSGASGAGVAVSVKTTSAPSATTAASAATVTAVGSRNTGDRASSRRCWALLSCPWLIGFVPEPHSPQLTFTGPSGKKEVPFVRLPVQCFRAPGCATPLALRVSPAICASQEPSQKSL